MSECTCRVPPRLLPDGRSNLFEQMGDLTYLMPVPGGIGSAVEDVNDNCPEHGVEAGRQHDRFLRRCHILAWREIRKAWPKARRDAALAIGINWWEYADPEGDYHEWWPV